MTVMREKLSVQLMEKILALIADSGANLQEASCALKAAEAFLPEAELQPKPTFEIS